MCFPSVSRSVPGSYVEKVAATEVGVLLRSIPNVSSKPKICLRTDSVAVFWFVEGFPRSRPPPASHSWTTTLGTASFIRSPAPALGVETPDPRGWRYARRACCATRRDRKELKSESVKEKNSVMRGCGSGLIWFPW